MRLTHFQQTEKGAQMSFSETSPDEVAAEVGRFMESIGLNLEEQTATGSVWGSGSKVGRALGGAIAKRRKFDVMIDGADPVNVIVASAMSGWGGGAIGASKEKKSRKEIAEQLHAHFQPPVGA